jgi:hypothetical protein
MPFDALLGALRDRVRLWRLPGAQAIIDRQERYLQGRQATSRRWEQHDTPEGAVHARVATTGPAKEAVAPLPEDMMAGIREAAGMALRFVHDHVAGFDAPNWSLQDLDDAFAGWTSRGDRLDCPPVVVERIVGSALGEFCVRTLGMRWVLVTDEYGTVAAIEGPGNGQKYKSMRSFPFAAVSKRIEAGESHFLMSIYRVLEAQMA